jgi:penicillin-binding protein 2
MHPIEKNIRSFNLTLTVFFLILLFSSFYLQVIRGHYYYNLDKNNRIRIISYPALRGNILDCNGQLLAGNKINFDLFVVPQELQNRKKLLGKLAAFLGVSETVLEKNYQRNYYAPFVPVLIKKNIAKEFFLKLEENKQFFPGVFVQPVPRRSYPHHNIASHIIGYIGKISRSALTKLKPYGYDSQDYVGKEGIELFLDPYLRGIPGGYQIEVNNQGQLVRVIGEKLYQKGKDVYLTIDLRWQLKINSLLKNKSGAIVILNPHTGEIIALASSPQFDPNIFILGTAKELERLLNDRSYPLVNRAISGLYPPGSIFKIVVAIAGLETERINRNYKIFCQGEMLIGKRKFKCWKETGHGWQDVKNAIIHSCNIYFYNLALKLGVEDIIRYAFSMGLGQKTGVELPMEKTGFLPTRLWKYRRFREKWFAGDTANLSIGQGFIKVTPIQLAVLISAIANGGNLIKAHLIKSIGTHQVSRINKTPLFFKKPTIKIIKEALFGVVNDPTGTGQRAKVKTVTIAGKTATAQVKNNTPHSLFIGYLPAENPEISFVVVLENAGGGGWAAANLVKQIGYFYQELKDGQK